MNDCFLTAVLKTKHKQLIAENGCDFVQDLIEINNKEKVQKPTDKILFSFVTNM